MKLQGLSAGDLAVKREGGAGDGSGAQGAEVHALARVVGEAGSVSRSSISDVGEEPVGNRGPARRAGDGCSWA